MIGRKLLPAATQQVLESLHEWAVSHDSNSLSTVSCSPISKNVSASARRRFSVRHCSSQGILRKRLGAETDPRRQEFAVTDARVP